MDQMKRWLNRAEYREWEAWKRKGTKRKKKKSKIEKRQHKAFKQEERIEAEKRCNEYLNIFWWEFNRAATGEQRLAVMKKAAVPGWRRVSQSLQTSLRAKFLRRKYPEALYQEECLVCNSEYARERHHIVPLHFGGTNDMMNLLRICYTCHEEIHPWMKKS